MAEPLERFQPTSGRITGVLALVVTGLGVLMALKDRGEPYALSFGLGALFLGILAWAAMLRPGLWVTPSTLVLRNMFETIHVPLVAIESMAVRQVLAVRAGDRRYVSPAVGKSWRKMVGRSGQAPPPSSPEEALSRSYADFVEARIRHLCDEARSREGVPRGSAEQYARAEGIRREPAWLEISLLSVTGVGFLLTLFL